MTLPSVIRIFFAIDLPLPIKQQLGDFISMLKKKIRPNAIRWTKSENLHITLQFLAQVELLHLPKLIQFVRDEIENKPFFCDISLNELQLFPNPYRPRVIVLTVTPEEGLTKLSECIGQGIRNASYPTEEKPFRAHLTLGRIKQPQGMDFHFLSEFSVPPLGLIAIKEVVLFRSEPQPEGSHYMPLDTIMLSRPEMVKDSATR